MTSMATNPAVIELLVTVIDRLESLESLLEFIHDELRFANGRPGAE